MVRLLMLMIITMTFTGCASGENWNINASTSEPIKDKCEQVIFGESNCARSDRDKLSDKEKTARLDDRLEVCSKLIMDYGIAFRLSQPTDVGNRKIDLCFCFFNSSSDV